MERELCLVLDTLGKYRLVLKKGLSHEIDEYTSKYFENSDQIREKYENEINAFLNYYKELLQKSNNPNYKGRIVVVIPENVGKNIENYQRKVLYKKHIVTFNEAIKNKSLMLSFSLYEKKSRKRLVSDHFHYIVRLPWNRKNAVKKYIDEWISKEKKNKENYYEIVRDMMIVYEQDMEYNDYLKSFDEVYNNYKCKKEQQVKERIKKRNKIKLQQNIKHTIVASSTYIDEDKEYIVNGSKYTVDELHLFDLDDIDSTSTYIPDGVKRK